MMNIIVSGEGSEVYLNNGIEESEGGSVFLNNKKLATKECVDLATEDFMTKDEIREEFATKDSIYELASIGYVDEIKNEMATVDYVNEIQETLREEMIMRTIDVSCETIVFQTNVKLEKDTFPFVLGMKGPSNKSSGYIVPYGGIIDIITLSSQELDQDFKVKLYVNGEEVMDLIREKETYFKQHKHLNVELNSGDVIQFQSDCQTQLTKSLHTIQMTAQYTKFY